MFKKPLSNVKTSAPLRSSDRRKLKQKIIATFNITPEEGELLVPDGLASLKFSTHLEETGIVYLSNGGDPLWFTVGKGSEELVPTTYTLWKKPDLLPFLSTPDAVIPILTGGADLMIPGVVHHTRSIAAGQLVCIRKYSRNDDVRLLSVPLAVGKMALPSDQIQSGTEKGKAVHVLHVWKDHLWEMGSKPDVPASEPIQSQGEEQSDDGAETESQPATESVAPTGTAEEAPLPPDASEPPQAGTSTTATPSADQSISYTPAEVTELLQKSLVQAIAVMLSSAPSSTFPIPATLFYTNYILPSRPAFPTYVLAPASMGETTASDDSERPHIDPQEINIKASTHKSLTTFLKAADKQGLITTKAPQKHSQQTDLLIISVASKHPLMTGHQRFASVKDIEQEAAKKAEREEREKEAETQRDVEIKDLWKPHLSTVDLFKEFNADTNALYTPAEVRSLILDYINTKNLVNANDKAYVNLDEALQACISAKSSGKSKGKDNHNAEPSSLEFMKRDELVKQVIAKMQDWYEVCPPGKDTIQKKGTLKPIQVVMKVRQGRKASTLITGFEPFSVVSGEEMAEDLRKLCAGATSVSPIVGKPAGSGLEVLVQGKQSTAVVDYLTGKGIPKRWIEVRNLSGKKK